MHTCLVVQNVVLVNEDEQLKRNNYVGQDTVIVGEGLEID